MKQPKSAMKQPKSAKPGKQRKFRAKAPLHLKKRFLKVHISKELKQKLGIQKRTLVVNKGDTIRFISGSNKGKTGKVSEVDYNKVKIYVDGITKTNVKGQEKNVSVEPSNVELIDVNITDYRKSIMKSIMK